MDEHYEILKDRVWYVFLINVKKE